MRHLVDYNCYWNTADQDVIASLNEIDGTDANTITKIRAIWAGYNDSNGDINDANSIIADPLFANAAGGDFRLLPDSPCVNTGQRDSADGYSSMGAWQQKQRGSMLGAMHV
jgi:hypothetical protein